MVKNNSKIAVMVTSAYLISIIFFFLGYLFPQTRLWAFNIWSHYQPVAVIIFIVMTCIIPFSLYLLNKKRIFPKSLSESSKDITDNFIPMAMFVIIVFLVLFYALRARTHFLGDGYSLLSNLTDTNSLLKMRNMGEDFIHQVLYSFLSSDNNTRSLLSYQIISYLSGFALLLITVHFSSKVFKEFITRLFFFLGITSGGFMLLYFGYVENYSMFVSNVALFCFWGILIIRRMLNKWFILIPTIMGIFFHIFGVALIPGAVYLMISNTVLHDRISKFSLNFKLILLSFLILLSVATFYFFYFTFYYFEFALVPVLENRFTIEGYTLFSINHLMDILNLLFVLFPGLLVSLAVILTSPIKMFSGKKEYSFLLILLISSLGIVFIFDPKLGMPRDWDLFAFAGVPLTILPSYYLADNHRKINSIPLYFVMIIILGFLSLFCRAYNVVDQNIALTYVNDYIKLDPIKNRSALYTIVDYYKRQGDSVSYNSEVATWETKFPERSLNRKGVTFLDQKKFDEAIPLFRKAIELNPAYSSAYSNLASCYLYLKQFDSAVVYFDISLGMNPYSSVQYNNLGSTYLYKKEYDKAEKYLNKAIELDPENAISIILLAEVYKQTGELYKQIAYLQQASQKENVPLASLLELTELYIIQNDFDRASNALQKAIDKGLDSALVTRIKQKYPQIIIR